MKTEEIERNITEGQTWVKGGEAIARFGRERIAELEAQLAEAEKPKLRHGDYGLCEKGKELYGFTYYKSINGAGYFLTHLTKQVYHGCWPKVDKIVFVGGNFADLKARQEPLKDDFQFGEGTRGNTVEIDAGRIIIRPDLAGSVIIDKDDIPTFILNLQRLAYTAEASK